MKTHELTKHPLYRKFYDIKKRCYNKNAQNYYLYGGRGIIICDEWRDNFKSFYDWSIINNWSEGMFIDRINYDGNYCPENCRYVSLLESANNKRNNIYIKYGNKLYTLSELLREKGLSNKYMTIRNRIVNLKWDLETALVADSYPIYHKRNLINKKSKVLVYKNEEYSLIALCRKLNIEDKYHTVKARINKLKWSVEKSVIFSK